MTTPNNPRHGVKVPFVRSSHAAAPKDREAGMSRDEFLKRFRRVREASNLDEWACIETSDKTEQGGSSRFQSFQDAFSNLVKRLTRRFQSVQDVSSR